MNYRKNISQACGQRKSLVRLLLAAGPFIAISVSGSALAQTALSGSDLILPATAAPTADMIILKTMGVGGLDKYSVAVTNTGPVPVTGAVVTDTADTGGICPKNNPVTITGSGVPEGSFTIANLTGSGIALVTLDPGQSATLTYSC
jgi:uncharacterized repeat protein (TIGR01451 family)